jgi:hypothetical protein
MSGSDPEKLKPGRFPAWLVKTGLIVSILLFVGFGAFLAGRVLRIAHGKDARLVIPFILFVLFFCAVPVLQAVSALRKMKKIPSAGAAAAPPASIEEVRRDEHSKIQVRDAPDGREFYFPGAPNPAATFVIATLMLFWSAMVWGLFYTKAPLVFPIVFGLAGVVVFLGCLSLWLKETRVTINSKGVHAAQRWVFFDRKHSFDAGDIARFDSKIGMRSGQQVYYDIQLITRAERKITVATGITSKPETNWLVQEMTKALGRGA